MIKRIIASPEEMISFGSRIGHSLHAGDVIAMHGTLAAGKTTMTKGIAEALGIQDPVTSPTFTLVSEYYGTLPLYHVDVYRLDTSEEFLDIGAEEMIYGKGICVIEWSEKVASVLPQRTIEVSININNDNTRTVTIDNWPYGEIHA